MFKAKLALIWVFISFYVDAQSCDQFIESAYTIVRENYAGYTHDEENSQPNLKAADDRNCEQVLVDFVESWKDPHFHLYRDNLRLTSYSKNTSGINHPTGLMFYEAFTVLRIASLELQYTEQLKRLIASSVANPKPNLVIDLRSNGGGSFFAMLPILEWLNIRGYSSTWQVKASTDNINQYSKILAELEQLPFPAISKFLSKLTHNMSKNPGSLVTYSVPADLTYQPDTQPQDFDRIFVLMDQATASTAEETVIALRSSPKVRIFGTRSAGILDFGDPLPFQIPKSSWTLSIPSQKRIWSNGQGIDHVGIVPDVIIDIPTNLTQQWLNETLLPAWQVQDL